MLRLAKDGAEVVHEAASNPDGACIRGRQHCKGGEEGREEDVDGEIHHQDGDPDTGARCGRCGRCLGLLHRLDARADVVLEHPNRDAQKLRAK